MLRLLATPVLLLPVLVGVPVPAGAADDAPGPRETRALRALDRAVEALTVPGPEQASAERPHLTEVLTDLAHSLPSLEGDDREQARALLARPTAPNATDKHLGAAWSQPPEKGNDEATCIDAGTATGPAFCVHYIPESPDYVSEHETSTADVDAAVSVMKTVWKRQIVDLGYTRPVSDGTEGNPEDVAAPGLVDIYLADIGGNGYFGYAVTEKNIQASPGYMVIENDFAELVGWDPDSPADAAGLRKVTAAHEFFHLVQFGYDSYENAWLKESTAAWMEDQVFDWVNDSRAYIKYGSLARVGQPLTTYSGMAHYGTWVFHELYARRHGIATVRELWENSAKVGGNSWWSAFRTTMKAHGSTPYTEFQRFGGATIAPGLFAAEGHTWPKSTFAKSWRFGNTGTTGSSWRSVTRKHLSGVNIAFRPKGTAKSAKLRIRVDGPSTTSNGTKAVSAFAIVTFSDGSRTKVPFTLDSTGFGARTVRFDAKSSKNPVGVVRVALNLLNTLPSGDGKVLKYRARVVR